ncbi:hypothetical protein KY290_006399 [Solanum tuberosum]|uniref:Leucine-rich repeat-containing N-terminal plant-type domain-containing protein n=1 Tax=Solanum tuberosum TaxID=4113 RepID=A0ABQ7WJ81_SOLTU|nr:hypothetical protein KY284_006446 [Solanum tuberosum]KAH0723715.1 hypothetical protein KY289_006759 [Solanum tuberosum]KAH0779972.1 hypothetical protein KY290_006399 [Solanum tuberosum]
MFVVCVGICRENEQRALETLKKEVYDPSNRLSSWVVGIDCCQWEGIVCNNLTHHVIDLSIYVDWFESRYLRINNLKWLISLSSLENLKMESVDISKANEWLQVINMLPSLVDLRLYNCSLHHITPLLDHHNFSSLKSLDLSWNRNLNSSVPKWVFNLPNLVSLHLSYCNFTGPFPDGPVNLTSLTTLKASGNSFNCRLPKWLFDLNNLEHLVLFYSGIEGAIQSKSGNITKLKYLDLSYNNLSSTIPNWLYGCKDLESLVLGGNHLEGTVSMGLGNASSLSTLRLGWNKLTGVVPESVGHLSMLQGFSICNNRLEGVVTESHFSKLTHLRRLEYRPSFPMWLRTQNQIMYVGISDCGIQGEVPIISTDHEPSGSPLLIYLSSNNFSGPIPLISTNVRELDLSNNSFSKGLSNFLCEAKNGSYTLEILNLGGNDLSEEIPDCWMNWPELIVLILRDNNLIGSLPRSIEVLSNLLSLDLRRNRLNGPFPSSLENCIK